MNINVDMDGVVADFDGHYTKLFGYRPTRWPDPDTVDWAKIANVPNFFATIPMMQGAQELLQAVHSTGRPWRMLTGVPKSIDLVANDKVDWIRARVVPPPPVMCCRSRDKYLHCQRGDILIDDYLKYRHLWENAGGVFIHHTSAESSIKKLYAHIAALTIESA